MGVTTSGGRDRVVLSAVVFAVLFAQVLLYPGIPDLVSALGATPTDWAGGVDEVLDAGMWFLTAEFLGFVLFAGVWGAVSDALGRRTPLVVAGALGGAVGYLALPALSALGAPYAAVLAVRFLQGAATIGALSLAITTLMDLPGGHGRNMGAAGLAIGAGTGLGAPVGGQLYGLGPLVPVQAATVALAGAGLLAALATDRSLDSTDSSLRALARVRDRPALAVPYAFGFVDRLTAGFFALVGTVYFQSELGLGLDPADTGLLLGAFFVPFALLQYPLGRLSDTVGRVLPVAAGSLVYGVAVVGVFYAPSLRVTALAMVTVGVLGALVAPATMALVSDLAAADHRGAAMGGFNIAGSLGFLAGIVVGASVAATAGFEAAFLVVGLSEVVIAVAAVPLLLRLDVPTVAWLDAE